MPLKRYQAIIYLHVIVQSDDQIPLDENTGLANWDSPTAVDFKGLNEAINSARKNPFALLNQKAKPLQNNHHGSDLLSLTDFSHLYEELDTLKDIIFIIVEGFLLFCDEDTCNNLDTKFFITASKEILKARRENRPGYVTLQGYWVDPPGYFDQIVWPQFVLWNKHLIDDTIRDPLIHVYNTDNTTALDMTSNAIHEIKRANAAF